MLERDYRNMTEDTSAQSPMRVDVLVAVRLLLGHHLFSIEACIGRANAAELGMWHKLFSAGSAPREY